MKQEEKELLLQDLCGRLPYGIKCYITEINDTRTLGTIQYENENSLFDFWNVSHTRYEHQLYLSEFKPYLFPLSSMTKEQKIRISAIQDMGLSYYHLLVDRYNEWHIDYRGLIEKGLALDATGLNIY